jgi:hypothetical protein
MLRFPLLSSDAAITQSAWHSINWIMHVGIQKISNAVTVNLWSERTSLEKVRTLWNSHHWLSRGHQAF